jgi:hypothetical protein
VLRSGRLTGPRTAILEPLRELAAQGIGAVVEAMDALNAVDQKFLALDASTQGFLRDRMLASSAAALIGMSRPSRPSPTASRSCGRPACRCSSCTARTTTPGRPALQADMARAARRGVRRRPRRRPLPRGRAARGHGQGAAGLLPEPASEL